MFGYAGNRLIEWIDSHTPRIAKKWIKRLVPGVSLNYYHLLRSLTRDGIHLVKIRHGPLAGRYFRCSLKNERDYWLGTWEQDVQVVLATYLRSGMVIYDVGAHIGFFSLIAAHLVQPTGRVFAFEPCPSNEALAHENFSLSPDLARFIELLPVAVSDATGFAKLLSATPGSTTASVSRVVTATVGPDAQVPTITLDAFVKQGNPPPHLIKMDIEGGEISAFRGMIEILRQHRPILIVEIHDTAAWSAFQEVLQQAHYLAAHVTDINFSATPRWTERDQYIARPI